jgi:hypothetical protein
MQGPASAGLREVALRSRFNTVASSKQRSGQGRADGKVIHRPSAPNFAL